MALSYTEINAFTVNDVIPKTTDIIFKDDPLFVRLMSKNKIQFQGGLQVQRPLMFAGLASSFFGRGDQFDTGYRVTDTALTVNMKYAYVNVTLLGTDDVLNRGEAAAFSIVESKMSNAALTMGQLMGQNIYYDGSGVLSSTKAFDGLMAWIDDGNSNSTYSTATDYTRSFASVGGITRSDIVAGPSTGAVTSYAQVNGINSYTNRNVTTFTLNDLNTAYGYAWFGTDQPDLLVCTQNAYNKIWNATQPLQRYQQENSDLAKVGIKSFQFNGADVVVSKYLMDDVGSSNGVIYGLNTNYLELYVSSNKKFQFGFTGFKEAQNTIDVSGQFIFAGNLLASNPRTSFKMIGSALA